MNFGMGLTRVRFGDYFWGTALGILVGPSSSPSSWDHQRGMGGGRLGAAPFLQGFFSVGLFVFSLFIPKIIGKMKKEGK